MDFKALRSLLLFTLVTVLTGCATETYDPTTDMQPAPAHDDSHGWGGNLQGGGR